MALYYNFVQIFGAGKLALSERPKIKEIKQLIPSECSRIVTILPPKGERAQMIGTEAATLNIEWTWLKLSKANYLTIQEANMFRMSLTQIYNAILSGENVLVHCSAGLHRTGMFAYALLKLGGLDHQQRLAVIKNMRSETFDALEEKYIKLADSLV